MSFAALQLFLDVKMTRPEILATPHSQQKETGTKQTPSTPGSDVFTPTAYSSILMQQFFEKVTSNTLSQTRPMLTVSLSGIVLQLAR